MSGLEKKDDFQPEKLVGKTISFKCVNCLSPIRFKINGIKEHIKCTTMGWTYKGRADLVEYETTKGFHTIEYRDIVALLKTGQSINVTMRGLEYKIVSK